MAWADKQNDLIISLLTNRVYPNRNDSQTKIRDFRYNVSNKVCEILGIKLETDE